ncbi:protein LST8 homolog isoform X1 [Tanacetum coccineum]|uniref:Protein LST8 homolog isoform X1 n=1 Tax=Tanacetum coccineum TaxID=301880 RepID=A0ABQ4XFG0_9ASTR
MVSCHALSLTYKCDGKWMYSSFEDGTVKIWDLRSVKVNAISLLARTHSSSFTADKYWSSYLILALGHQGSSESGQTIQSATILILVTGKDNALNNSDRELAVLCLKFVKSLKFHYPFQCLVPAVSSQPNHLTLKINHEWCARLPTPVEYFLNPSIQSSFSIGGVPVSHIADLFRMIHY